MTHRTNGYLLRQITEAKADTQHERHSVAQALHSKFRALEDHFFDQIHGFVDVGLAVDQVSRAFSGDGGHPNIMTVHGCRHVSDLIESLDRIAEYIAVTDRRRALDVEEAYILLCAAHVHDAGNVGGRKNHAERSGDLIEDHKDLFSGTARREQVFEVARVHGGSDHVYGKDTFRSLNADKYQRPRVPLLAAILRLGDELSENPERVPAEVLKWYQTSGQSTLAYRYSECFRRFRLAQDQLFVTLRVYPAQHTCAAIVDDTRMAFWEYLELRLNKMEMEIRYCLQYARPFLYIRRIRVSIEYHEHERPSRFTRSCPLTLDLESGYPQELEPLAERCEELRGCSTLADYCTGETT